MLFTSTYLILITIFRFTHTEYIAYSPKTGINLDQIDFEFEARDAPAVYLFGDILMKCQVGIVKEDGMSLPSQELYVTLVNNSMHSLFSSLIMRINQNEARYMF